MMTCLSTSVFESSSACRREGSGLSVENPKPYFSIALPLPIHPPPCDPHPSTVHPATPTHLGLSTSAVFGSLSACRRRPFRSTACRLRAPTLTHTLTHTRTHSLTHSRTHSLKDSRTHSLTHSDSKRHLCLSTSVFDSSSACRRRNTILIMMHAEPSEKRSTQLDTTPPSRTLKHTYTHTHTHTHTHKHTPSACQHRCSGPRALAVVRVWG